MAAKKVDIKKTPSHYQEATGHASELRVNKSSGPVDTNADPKTSHPSYHPYHGKKTD